MKTQEKLAWFCAFALVGAGIGLWPDPTGFVAALIGGVAIYFLGRDK